MSKRRVSFQSGSFSLEGVLSVPVGPDPAPAVLVCHPHPLYGGSMSNNVVNAVFDTLVEARFAALKFNFRGVGESQGSFTHGLGEGQDVVAALHLLHSLPEVDSLRIGLIGYSAGAGFAFSTCVANPQVKVLAAISPPLPLFDFTCLAACLKPKLLICGSRDDFTPSSQFLSFCETLPEPKDCQTIDGPDHFWVGYESLLADRVRTFFTRELSSP